MNHDIVRLDPGLYLVATPIGSARDITLRGLDILASADVIAAEDTRSMRRLMELHGVKLGERPLFAYHDHNGARMRPRLLGFLAQGKSVAYASEAGTPLIADPGYDLARDARAQGYGVTAAPGPSAIITALSIAGLATDAFFFAGFLPNTRGQRKNALERLAAVPGTLVFYESPKRLAAMLADAAEVLGGAREAAVCRELTKKFEEVRKGTLDSLVSELADAPVRGEIVVVIDRGRSRSVSDLELESLLREALAGMSVRDAADMVATGTGLPRRKVYQAALKLESGS